MILENKNKKKIKH